MKVYRPKILSKFRLNEIEYNIGTAKTLLDDVSQIVSRETFSRKKKRSVCAEFATLDTETSSIAKSTCWNNTETDIGFVYLIQLHINHKNYIFRNLEEFSKILYELCEVLDREFCTLVIYVHNLSFEWQFLKSYITVDDVFSIKNRKIARIYAYNGAIEFRCSYLLSNMSLEKFTENYCTEEYRKDKELIDYEVLRYPWTELDNNILYYSLMDVITLHKAIESIMNREGDTIQSIPMTNTGYVRRACKKACIGEKAPDHKHYIDATIDDIREFTKYKENFRKMETSLEEYNMLVRAFRGGNTHANRYKVNRIIENVDSYDFASSYPSAIICSDEFPIGKLMECTDDVQSLADLQKFSDKFFILAELIFYNIELRDWKNVTVPYISKSKCIIEENKENMYDNGRVLKVVGQLNIVVTGIEIPIIVKQYKGTCIVKKCYYSVKGYLPLSLRKTVYEWYEKKTSLKKVAGKEYEYMRSKNRVNATYGMMVEKIVKDIIEYSNGNIISRKPTEEEAAEQLHNFFTPMQQKFLLFQWGVAVTAIARVRLQEMIDLVGEDFVYCDTDSCKFMNAEKYRKKIEEYNQKWIKYADKCGCPYTAKTKNGELQILGIADFDGHYDRFKTLGAKKYSVEQNGELEITIAGVPKVAGAQLLGNIENFKIGYHFKVPDNAPLKLRQAWKKSLTYNDDFNEIFLINGNQLHIKSNVAVLRTTYQLDITDEYEEVIRDAQTQYETDNIF